MKIIQLFPKITICIYPNILTIELCPKLHGIFYLSILKIMRFGDVDLTVKLNYADL